MCLYLTKRGATYYFRRPVPKNLRAIIGASEWTFSLGTKERHDAKRLRSQHALKTDQLIEAALAQLGGQGEGLAEASPAPIAIDGEWLGQFAAEEAAFAARKAAESAARRLARREERDRVREKIHGSTASMPTRYGAIRDLVREAEERAERAERLAADLTASNNARQGLLVGTGSSPLSGRGAIKLEPALLNLWAAERRPRPKTVDAHRAVARWFIERIGNKDISEIGREDVLRFKDALVSEGQKAANIKVKLSRMRTLTTFAHDNGYAPSNAGTGVSIRVPEGERHKRKPFDTPALQAIFASPVFTDGLRPAPGGGEAAYWLPLLGLYTGARLEELGYLCCQDVAEHRYLDGKDVERSTWAINIAERGDDGRLLKTANSERIVPLSDMLLRLGFPQFVSSIAEAGGTRLFPELKPNKYGTITAKWGEWFSKYRREVCGVTDRSMVFHSFRHTFKDMARHAGIPDGVQRQLMGHSPGDVAGDYGSGYSMHQLVSGIGNYKVPGLKLPAAPVD
jgi:integrase